ncbi:hypothetical protein OL229_03725 [Neisseriaceae bacterium JH1-16]|nr:hypothetical protein [Neisseriaceae bacterium JH1-16]
MTTIQRIAHRVPRLRLHNDAWAGDLLACAIGLMIALVVLLY